MSETNAERIVAGLRGEAGDSLRSVATYTREGYDLLYVRDGLETKADVVADDIHNDLVLEGLGTEHLEDLFRAGSLDCSMHGFDELVAFHFPGDDHTGLFVSLDADASIDLSDFVDRCKELGRPPDVS